MAIKTYKKSDNQKVAVNFDLFASRKYCREKLFKKLVECEKLLDGRVVSI